MKYDVTSLTLLQRLKAGDAAAWQRLVFLYTPLLHHWCQRAGVQGADAEDVVQDVLDAVVRSIQNFQREKPGETFRGWLRGITRFKVCSHWRQRNRQPEAIGGDDSGTLVASLPDPVSSESAEDEQERHVLFYRALDLVEGEFEPKTYRAFKRVALENASAAEAAAELGMSASAVRMAKCRVLRRFREELDDVMR